MIVSNMEANTDFMTTATAIDQYKYVNPLLLAYVGDAVYELRVRKHLLDQGAVKMTGLHEQAVGLVNAQRQSLLYAQLEAELTQEEQEVFRRGRNARSGHQPPRVSVAAYRRATGVEALIGWLHLTGREERLDRIFEILFQAQAVTDHSEDEKGANS